MKRIGYVVTACFCLLSGISYAGTPDTGLFLDALDALQVDLKPVNTSIVTRQRLVTIRFDLLSEGNENMILLNLFNDVLLTAMQDHTEKNASDGYAWIGYLDGTEEGQVTLVVEDQKLACAVLLTDVVYHVRYVEDDIHIVREIDPSAFPVSSRTLSARTLMLESSLSAQESEVFDLVNQERAIAGLHLLRWNDRLFDAARGHSEDMAEQNYFSHDSLDGRSFSDRITEAGYLWNACGENIAFGYTTPLAVMNAWMNSPGHRNNILGSYFCDIGVGYAGTRHYWTQDFGRESGVSACPVGNQEPMAAFSADPSSGEVPLTVSFDASGSSDPDGTIVSYDWIFGDGSIGSGVSPVHVYTSAGTYTVTLTVIDNGSPPLSDTDTIPISVSGNQDPPILDPIGDKEICEDEPLEFTISASDPDGDDLTFSASNRPDGAAFDAETHTFRWTPDLEDAGNYTVTFTVTDDGNPPLSASETITIAVLECDYPPELDYIGDRSVNEGELLAFTISASDPNGDGLTYSVSNLPEGASFNAWTHLFSWIPDYDQADIYGDVVFSVTDDGIPPLSDSETITITVYDANRPPALDLIGNKTVAEEEALEFSVTAGDPDGDTLTYTASGIPDGADFDSSTQTFSWTPGIEESGNYDVLFRVTDNGSPPLSDAEEITISVGDVNRPPEFEPLGNRTVGEGDLVQFAVTASDPDGDALMYTGSILPVGAIFDVGTQTFSWTPGSEDSGLHTVAFTVTDDGSPPLSDSETITITVSPTPDIPTDDTEEPDEAVDPGDETGNNADPNNDDDSLIDWEEDDGPNGGDANNDGTLDSEQENVTSLRNINDPNYVTLEATTGTTISNAEAVPAPDDPPSGVAFTYGFFDFTISGLDPGGTTTMVLYLPDGAAPTTFYKYGPEPSDPNDHWYEFLYDGETGAEINENFITLHFVDGKRGDHDLDDTNGVIVDPGGPGFSNGGTEGGGNNTGGSSGCFISAATFSSSIAPWLNVFGVCDSPR